MIKRYVATTLGFVIAPLFAAISFTAVTAVAEGGLGLLDMRTLGWVLIIYFYTLGATLVIALPAFLILNHFDKITSLSTLFTGFFCGAMMALIFRFLNPFVVVPIGGVSALLFWLIWRWGGSSDGEFGGHDT